MSEPTPVSPTPLPGWHGGDGNAAYLDKTLRHGPVETYFDESVHWTSVVGIWARAALFAFLFLALFSFVNIGLAALGSVVMFFVVFLLSTQSEPIGEWRTVLADRATACPSVYSAIHGKLVERRLPIQSVQARRTYNAAGKVDHRLVLIDGHYRVYVSVFEYGTSLYLGWMMYRYRKGASLLGRFLTDFFTNLTRGQDVIDLMLRTERPRALREVAHALCREGLHVAIERLEVPTSYGFPGGLPPIETLPGAGGPVPGLRLSHDPFSGRPAAPVPPAHRMDEG